MILYGGRQRSMHKVDHAVEYEVTFCGKRASPAAAFGAPKGFTRIYRHLSRADFALAREVVCFLEFLVANLLRQRRIDICDADLPQCTIHKHIPKT